MAASFAQAWRESLAAFGQPSVATVVLPGVVAGASADRVTAMADGAAGAVARALTAAVETVRPAAGDADETFRYEGADLLDAAAALHRDFLARGLGDGFPVVPPTRAAVDRMLAGTREAPGATVAVLDPAFGDATVERIAVNAVMAGCEPAHMPILLAAVRAVSQPQCLLREMQVSTIAEAPLVLVNGPAAARIGLHGGACALGPAPHNPAAVAIGRALRLVLVNIGGTVPGRSDINTQGSPLKFGLCLAEAEAASPFRPFHVSRGFRADESTATVVAVTGSAGVIDIRSTEPEPLLDAVASALRFEGSWPIGDWLAGGKKNPMTGEKVISTHTLLLAPDHARVIAQAGWSRGDVQRYLHERATLPIGTLVARRPPKTDARGRWIDRPDLQALADDPRREVPVAESPEAFLVAVAGGIGNVSQFFWGNYGVGITRVGE